MRILAALVLLALTSSAHADIYIAVGQRGDPLSITGHDSERPDYAMNQCRVWSIGCKLIGHVRGTCVAWAASRNSWSVSTSSSLEIAKQRAEDLCNGIGLGTCYTTIAKCDGGPNPTAEFDIRSSHPQNTGQRVAETPTPSSRDCFVSGIRVPHGTSRNFYMFPSSQRCEATTRTCSDGQLSGNTSFDVLSCTLQEPRKQTAQPSAPPLQAPQPTGTPARDHLEKMTKGEPQTPPPRPTYSQFFDLLLEDIKGMVGSAAWYFAGRPFLFLGGLSVGMFAIGFGTAHVMHTRRLLGRTSLRVVPAVKPHVADPTHRYPEPLITPPPERAREPIPAEPSSHSLNMMEQARRRAALRAEVKEEAAKTPDASTTEAKTKPETAKTSSEGPLFGSNADFESQKEDQATPGAKGFGIAALVISILAIFVPVYGIHVSGIAILCACVAAFMGDVAFAIATSVIVLVNTFVLSPSVWLIIGLGSGSGFVFFLLCVAPLLAIGARKVFTVPRG
jgi:hypothetical protein